MNLGTHSAQIGFSPRRIEADVIADPATIADDRQERMKKPDAKIAPDDGPVAKAATYP